MNTLTFTIHLFELCWFVSTRGYPAAYTPQARWAVCVHMLWIKSTPGPKAQTRERCWTVSVWAWNKDSFCLNSLFQTSTANPRQAALQLNLKSIQCQITKRKYGSNKAPVVDFFGQFVWAIEPQEAQGFTPDNSTACVLRYLQLFVLWVGLSTAPGGNVVSFLVGEATLVLKKLKLMQK